jgi:hypothetical protein
MYIPGEHLKTNFKSTLRSYDDIKPASRRPKSAARGSGMATKLEEKDFFIKSQSHMRDSYNR